MFPVVFGVGMDKPLEFLAGRTPKVTKIDSEKCEICAELAGLGIEALIILTLIPFLRVQFPQLPAHWQNPDV